MTCLACVVVFCTVYALILPAVTIENNVSTSNTAVNENTFVPPEKNIYPIDAYNTYEGNPNVILLSPKLDTLNEAYKGNRAISIENFFTVDEVDNFDYSNWIAYFIQVRGGRFQVIRRQDPSNNIFYVYNDNQEAYIILVRKSYEDEHELYIPTAGPDATAWENEAVDGVGDTVKNIWLPGGNPHSVQNSSGTPLAYFTFSPKENTATADVRGDDLPAIADSAIKFQLFDYNEKINRPAADSTDWREITPYFQFRGQNDFNGAFDTGQAISTYDADGFTVNHATVERKLTDNYPVLDPNRNASGDPKKLRLLRTNFLWRNAALNICSAKATMRSRLTLLPILSCKKTEPITFTTALKMPWIMTQLIMCSVSVIMWSATAPHPNLELQINTMTFCRLTTPAVRLLERTATMGELTIWNPRMWTTGSVCVWTWISIRAKTAC